jgi:hypothetical protein
MPMPPTRPYQGVGGGEDLGQRDVDAFKVGRDLHARPGTTPVRLGKPPVEIAANGL